MADDLALLVEGDLSETSPARALRRHADNLIILRIYTSMSTTFKLYFESKVFFIFGAVLGHMLGYAEEWVHVSFSDWLCMMRNPSWGSLERVVIGNKHLRK